MRTRRFSNIIGSVLIPGILFLSSATVQAAVAGVFSKGRTHLAIYGGTGYAFDNDYFVFGLSAYYYLTDGLSIGLAAESWSGEEPGIVKVTPAIQYVLYQSSGIKPYVGAFYRRVYIEDLEDLDSAGGRAGILIAGGRNTFFGAGVVYESYLDCTETVYTRCDDTYPEFSFTIAF